MSVTFNSPHKKLNVFPVHWGSLPELVAEQISAATWSAPLHSAHWADAALSPSKHFQTQLKTWLLNSPSETVRLSNSIWVLGCNKKPVWENCIVWCNTTFHLDFYLLWLVVFHLVHSQPFLHISSWFVCPSFHCNQMETPVHCCCAAAVVMKTTCCFP